MQTLFDGLFRFFGHIPGISHLAFVLLQWVGLGNDAAELVPKVSLMMLALIMAATPLFIRFVVHLFLMGNESPHRCLIFPMLGLKRRPARPE